MLYGKQPYWLLVLAVGVPIHYPVESLVMPGKVLQSPSTMPPIRCDTVLSLRNFTLWYPIEIVTINQDPISCMEAFLPICYTYTLSDIVYVLLLYERLHTCRSFPQPVRSSHQVEEVRLGTWRKDLLGRHIPNKLNQENFQSSTIQRAIYVHGAK